MIIICTPKSNYQKLWEITVDGQYWKTIHQSIFGKQPIMPQAVDMAQLQECFDELEYQRVKRYTLWRLGMQSYHSAQLTKLLRERCVQQHNIDRICTFLQSASYIDDKKWVENLISRLSQRYSKRLLIAKLHSKGLSKQECELFIQKLCTSESELAAIKRLLKTRYHSKNCAIPAQRHKVIQSLQRRGFKYTHILAALPTQEECFDAD